MRSVVAQLALVTLLATPVAAQPAPTEAREPAAMLRVEEARAAYNKKKYRRAAKLFLTAVQANPVWAELYRDLARARVYSRNRAGAIIAYRWYLQLAREAEDREKVSAELELAVRQAGRRAPPADQPQAGAVHLAKARQRLAAGDFTGDDGVFPAIEQALAAELIGPDLARVRDEVAQALSTRTQKIVDVWWNPAERSNPLDLVRLMTGWERLGQQRTLAPQHVRLFGAVKGLAQLMTRDYGAAVDSLAEVAPQDPRMRYAQAIALARAGRFEEATQAAGAAAGAIDAPQVHLIHGLLLAHTRGDAVPVLRRALGM